MEKEENILGTEKIGKLIRKRAEAKKEKNWAEADRIRNELLSAGITLLDKPNGVVWKLNDGTENFYDK